MQTKSSSIQGTIEYKMFKYKKGNRQVSSSAVDRLVRSIKRNNLLSANPIIVNANYEIIDGQHRLSAAMRLKIPIYFVVFDPASLEEIQLLNANVRAWTAKDFMNSYIATGKVQYKQFKEFWEKWDFPYSITLIMMSDPKRNVRKHLHQDFKEGKFELGSINEAEEYAEMFESILKHAQPFVRHSNPFYYTIMRLYNQDPKIISGLIEKLSSGGKLYRVGTINEYLRLFEEILNKGNYGRPIRLY